MVKAKAATSKWKKQNCSKSNNKIAKRKDKKHYGFASVVNGSSGSLTNIHKKCQPINPRGIVLWKKTYEKCINWHQFHQMQYWKNVAINLKSKNDELKKKLEKFDKSENPQIDSAKSSDSESEEYETSSGSESEVDINEVDDKTNKIHEGYLEFLEITFKHREEIKKKRDSENENTQEPN